jgi:hypothetical protein
MGGNTSLSPTLSAPEAWDRYYQVNTDLDPLLGTPGIAAGAFGETVSAASGSFAQKARRGFFLMAEQPADDDPATVSAGLAGVPDSGAFASVCGTRINRVHKSSTGSHIHSEQLIRGAPVIGADSRLHKDDRGVFAITGRPLGDLTSRDPGPAPDFDAAEAIATCEERFELEGGLTNARVRHVVFPDAEGASWTYEVSFVVPADAADVRVYLRADDLSVLLAHNIASSAQGRAAVYAVNPLQNSDVTEVTLDGLDDPGNVLRGTAVDVSQASAARLDRPDRDFRVDPADPGFDEPQVYHHVWLATQYFKRIVASGLMDARPFAPMTVLVNDPRSPNNAYYMPSTGVLRFGLFGPRSSARSASMVYHEFGHAVSDSICELGRSLVRNTEARGLGEGYSDYFAASILGDPRFGDFVVNDPHGARNCSDAHLHFPDSFVGEEHDTGAVWAAVLWGIRGDIGAEKTDRLAIESLEFLSPASSFDDARVALHAVDERLFADEHRQLIDDAYSARAPE